MWKFTLPLVIFGTLVAVFFRGLQLDPSEVPSPLIGKPAPAFDLPVLNEPDRRFTDQSLRGQVSLLNVWATWCVGCRQEHDVLLAIAAAGEVPIVGLNYRDDPVSAQTWLRQLGNPYAVNAVDRDGKVAIDWGVYGAPETFVIDRLGIVRYKHIGPLTNAVVSERIMPLVTALNDE